ncbi:hypothetical protein J7384_17135 [Endozoicomonas sp. G2_1]|uniref:hypothetical protein n=1 Tax=Endozoicomonas sp. G2_1 TaxID=2821091 RepID=UPI001ADD2B40|nr:hypothetical protein [Endozoicomonas sp. G2_1]MBO9492089.1 hypothetical protein [Endozoicomonas sp. G2_1]
MSTRATYSIKNLNGQTRHFYIHHDGYPSFACVYFYRMLERPDSDRGCFDAAFLRGNPEAEPIESADEFGGLEYQYHFDAKTGELSYKTIDIRDDSIQNHKIDLWDFINQQTEYKSRHPWPVTFYKPVHNFNNSLEILTIKRALERANDKLKYVKEYSRFVGNCRHSIQDALNMCNLASIVLSDNRSESLALVESMVNTQIDFLCTLKQMSINVLEAPTTKLSEQHQKLFDKSARSIVLFELID